MSSASHKKSKRNKKPRKTTTSITSNEFTAFETSEIDVVAFSPKTEKAKASLSSSSSPRKAVSNSTSSNNKMANDSAGGGQQPLSATKSQKKKKSRNKDSDTSSGEERWLDAIESGKLEEIDDELKKIKDPKLMTARQRAMYERNAGDKEAHNNNAKGSGGSAEVLMSLPTGYKEKVMTAEAIQKAQLKSQKRKQLADEKREKDKQKTVQRLLKKKDSNKNNKQNKNKPTKSTEDVVTIKSNIYGTFIHLPPNVEFPIKASGPPLIPPKPVMCGAPGCTNMKKYSCSKTNVPLCSLECYRKNLAIHKLTHP